jgi:hypothetical protein
MVAIGAMVAIVAMVATVDIFSIHHGRALQASSSYFLKKKFLKNLRGKVQFSLFARVHVLRGGGSLIKNWDLFMFSKNDDSAEIERLRADNFALKEEVDKLNSVKKGWLLLTSFLSNLFPDVTERRKNALHALQLTTR